MGIRKRLQTIDNRSQTGSTIVHRPSSVVRLAIFASGAGSNAQKTIDHFKNNPFVIITLIASNKPEAGVLKIAEKENISSLIIEKEKFYRGNAYAVELNEKGIDFIVLAGFLWKIPSALIKAYPDKIINIHPALLPKYGGKGMYGHHVHEAVIKNKEKESGITIHYVDELYDHGSIIFQAKCTIEEYDTPDLLAAKIHLLEHANYPQVIETVIGNLKDK
jgi:phosphoribosylglycinamide formyltransferase-1